MASKLTWFPWDVVRVETDEDWRLMSDEERGLFIRLLNHSWLNEGLPADPLELSQLIGRPINHPKWARRVSSKFELEGQRLVNRTQEEFRTKARAKSLKATNSVRTRYERSTDESIRAYNSISISNSLKEKKEENEMNPRTDESWLKMLKAADRIPLVRSTDYAALYKIWRSHEVGWCSLSFEQRKAAIDGCNADRYPDPAYAPTMERYIFGKKWLETIRPKSNGNNSAPPKLSENERRRKELKEFAKTMGVTE